MCPSSTGGLPEEFRRTVAERAAAQRRSEARGEAPPETVGTGWLLVGIFLLVTVGVLMLLIFASGGNADSSMML
ncbi:hypothetical protein [Glycomyces tarimensis]